MSLLLGCSANSRVAHWESAGRGPAGCAQGLWVSRALPAPAIVPLSGPAAPEAAGGVALQLCVACPVLFGGRKRGGVACPEGRVRFQKTLARESVALAITSG